MAYLTAEVFLATFDIKTLRELLEFELGRDEKPTSIVDKHE